MEPSLIYEDEVLLVLDKPSGWIVNEAETTKNQPVIQSWLHEKFKDKPYPILISYEERSGIVHRLDKETSGILLIAKTKDSFENLQAQFKNREVHKKYTALVHGKVAQTSGVVKASVGRLPWRRDRFGVLPGGRESETNYKVVSVFKAVDASDFYTLVEFFPKTGRTHQIRIHAKYIGHPLVSDEFYAGRKTARKDRKWCPRLFLHASAISFIHPEKGQKIEFKSKLPPDLEVALNSLEKLHETA